MNIRKVGEYEYKEHHPRIFCKDDVSLSVQASEHAYCTPRDNYGPYTHVEVGFVYNAKLTNAWLEYADGDGLDSDVFGYVPVALVEEFIQEHGGIDIGKTLAVEKS